jgi:hypothetical protein
MVQRPEGRRDAETAHAEQRDGFSSESGRPTRSKTAAKPLERPCSHFLISRFISVLTKRGRKHAARNGQREGKRDEHA